MISENTIIREMDAAEIVSEIERYYRKGITTESQRDNVEYLNKQYREQTGHDHVLAVKMMGQTTNQ